MFVLFVFVVFWLISLYVLEYDYDEVEEFYEICLVCYYVIVELVIVEFLRNFLGLVCGDEMLVFF